MYRNFGIKNKHNFSCYNKPVVIIGKQLLQIKKMIKDQSGTNTPITLPKSVKPPLLFTFMSFETESSLVPFSFWEKIAVVLKVATAKNSAIAKFLIFIILNFKCEKNIISNFATKV